MPKPKVRLLNGGIRRMSFVDVGDNAGAKLLTMKGALGALAKWAGKSEESSTSDYVEACAELATSLKAAVEGPADQEAEAVSAALKTFVESGLCPKEALDIFSEPLPRESGEIPASKRAEIFNAVVDLGILDPETLKMENNEEHKASLEDILAKLSDDERETVMQAMNAPAMDEEKSEEEEKEDPAPEADKEEDQKMDADTLKRVESAEKRAEAAEKKVAELVAAQKRAETLKQAADLGLGGVEIEKVADALMGKSEAIKEVLDAVSAQLKESTKMLTEVKGSGESPDEIKTGFSVIKAKAQELIEKDPTLTMPQAIEKVVQANPQLHSDYQADRG